MASTTWLTSEQAARRLGVKPETVYAYVSRGLIRSERVTGSRRSRFNRDDVERHAARTRTGAGHAGALEVIIESQITLLEPEGRLAYRGWDVADAVATSTFEAVAGWLWTGDAEPVPFRPSAAARTVADALAPTLPSSPPADRWRTLLPAIRLLDPLRGDRRPDAVAEVGRVIGATLVETLPVLGRDPGDEASMAGRLWPRLTAAPPSGGRIRALDGALVLLADHGLASSTLAARVAASTWADPYLVVGAGLAAVGGPLHGGAAAEAQRLLDEAGPGGEAAAEAVGRRLEQGALLPGFGHTIYEEVDPRAEPLLDLLRSARCDLAAAEAVLEVVANRRLSFPNVDFALATMARSFDFIEGATEAVFSLARTVGWLAHAIEEYQHRLRFRTRMAYTGPRPADWPPPA